MQKLLVKKSDTITISVYTDDKEQLRKINGESDKERFHFILEHYLQTGELPQTDQDWKLFLRDKIEKEAAYNRLKKHPEDAPFMYEKFTDLQSFIKELCHPLNPIQIPEVGEKMSPIFEFHDIQSELSRLQTERASVTQELEKVKAYLKKREKDLVALEEGIPEKEKYRDELENIVANLRSDPGYERINNFVSGVQKFLDSVYNDKGQKEDERYLNRDKFLVLDNLRMEIPGLFDYMKSDKWFTESRVDEMSRAVMDQLEKLKKENRINAANDIGSNDEKVRKILQDTMEGLERIRKGPLDRQERDWMENNISQALAIMELNKTRRDAILRREQSQKS